SQWAQKSAVEERNPRLRLRVAEPAVVLEHAGAVRRQHQPREERADERMSPASELAETGLDVRRDETVERVVTDTGHGRERSHAPGVRSLVSVVGTLEVPRGREGERIATLAER